MKSKIVILLCLLLMAAPANAALSVTTVWELNASATANNANGGGFNYRNANMATDLSCTSPTGTAPVCSSASYNFGTFAADTGAYLFVQAGTNWNTNGAGNNGLGGGCWYPISSTNANAATIDATAGHAICVSDRGVSNIAANAQNAWTTNTLQGVANGSYVSGTASGTWSIDYSQSTGAGIAYTDAVIGGTTTQYTSVLKVVGKNIIGNVVAINSGTNCTVQRNEVVSTSTITATTDKSLGTAAASCTGNLGGAVSLNSSTTSNTDNTFFALGSGTNGTGAMVYWTKAGSYTLAVAVTNGNCGTQAPCKIFAYNTTRTDSATVAAGTAPIISGGANLWTLGSDWQMFNINYTGTASVAFATGTRSFLRGCKFTNTSTTAGRSAIAFNGTGSVAYGIEAISYRGRAVSIAAAGTFCFGCYMHDSDVGFNLGSGAITTGMSNSVVAGNVTAAVGMSAAMTTGAVHLENNTLYGREAKIGIGIQMITATTAGMFYFNNIIYGFTTGVSQVDAPAQLGYGNFNDYYNNTADVANSFKGTSDLALNPTFTSLTELTCLGTCSSATNVLTDSGQNFSSVVDDRDFVNILGITGTGSATGNYPIHSHTTTTLTLATPSGTALNLTSSGSGSAITYSVRTGQNFAIGTNLKAAGFPGAFLGNATTAYLDTGGVQRQESSSSGVVSYPIGH